MHMYIMHKLTTPWLYMGESDVGSTSQGCSHDVGRNNLVVFATGELKQVEQNLIKALEQNLAKIQTL